MRKLISIKQAMENAIAGHIKHAKEQIETMERNPQSITNKICFEQSQDAIVDMAKLFGPDKP